MYGYLAMRAGVCAVVLCGIVCVCVSLCRCAGRVLLLEVNPDPGLSMFHVMPPGGAVAVGSMPFECGGAVEVEEDYEVPVPPPGHLSVPSLEPPFTKRPTAMMKQGYVRILTLAAPAVEEGDGK